MIQNVLVALLIGWLLVKAGFAPEIIQGVYDLTNYELTMPAYYIAFALLGAVSKMLQKG